MSWNCLIFFVLQLFNAVDFLIIKRSFLFKLSALTSSLTTFWNNKLINPEKDDIFASLNNPNRDTMRNFSDILLKVLQLNFEHDAANFLKYSFHYSE